jgi:hypothetical protein
MSYLNTPLINYFKYKQATNISENSDAYFPILSVVDGDNGQLVVTTSNVENLSSGIAVTLSNMTNTSYDGNYTILSVGEDTFVISGTFTSDATGIWALASAVTAGVPGEPLDSGLISFYEAENKTIKLSTYLDPELTIPNTNPIVLDEIGGAPPIYMENEAYYIEIRDKFNNLISTIEDYRPVNSESSSETVAIENLLPSYGFDSIIDDGNYASTPLPVSSSILKHIVSSGWYWEFSSTNIEVEHTYDFSSVGFLGITGSPKNKLILTAANTSSGDIQHYLGCVIGDYNSFQGNSCAFKCHVSTSTSEVLTVYLRWTQEGISQTAIEKGTIETSDQLESKTLFFDIDDLPTGTYDNYDTLELLIGLPLNTDCVMQFTGTWLQITKDNSIEISDSSISQRTANQIFGNGFRELQQNPASASMSKPLCLNDGSLSVLDESGSIFAAPIGRTFDQAISMNEVDGTFLSSDDVKNTQLIAALRSMNAPSVNMLHARSVTGQSSRVVFSTTLGNYRSGPIVISASTRISSYSTFEGMSYGLKAFHNDSNDYSISVVFTDNFNAHTTPVGTINTKSSVLVNWFGTTVTEATSFSEVLNVVQIESGGSTSQAEALITFTDNRVIQTLGTANPGYLYSHYHESMPFGYFAYNDVANNPSHQAVIPPRLIYYNVENDLDPDSIPLSGEISTLLIDIPAEAPRNKIALATKKAINDSWEETIHILQTPENGDYIALPLETDGFVVIFWNIDLNKPDNPITDYAPIYVEINSSYEVIDVMHAIIDTVNITHASVPYWKDLGLHDISDNGLTYYIKY